MGKGDKRTRRGKIIKGTYGVSRPKKANVTTKPVVAKKKTTKPKAVKEETPAEEAPTADSSEASDTSSEEKPDK